MSREAKSFGADVRSPETAAPSHARPSRRRFAAPQGEEAPAPLFSAEALSSLYSVGARGERDVSLGFLLRQSAHSIERGRALIAARGVEIARATRALGAAEAGLAASAARLLLALFWVFIGVVLMREASAGFPVRGLDAASAALLARVFFAVGVLGVAAAFVGGYLIKAAEKNISGGANALGAEAGAIAREFGERVAELRRRIANESTASDVSRLHLIALEATAFFEGIGFLTEPDHARAGEKFRAFLAGHGELGARPGLSGLLLLGLGAVIGAVVAAGGAPAIGGAGLPLWAIIALPGLATLYAGMGILFASAGASDAGSAFAKAQDAALTRLRTAYAEAGAPRADDLIGGVEAALGEFRSRLDGRGAGSDCAAGHSQNDSSAREFAWARPPEAPRFVQRSFEAAPPVFRADAQGDLRKNFFGPRVRNAAPKQTASAPDAPPWLKD